MPLIVNTNVAALNSQRNLGINNSKLSKSLERLSSGLRINRAADDAAGLAIATKFAAQVRGLNQAVRNSNNTIALLQTAEGGINTITNILQRLRELSVQASSDDNTSTDRSNLASEANQLVTELTRVANTSEYNTMGLLDGSFSDKYFQIGANYGQNLTFTISDTRSAAIGARARFDADIADGGIAAVNANFTTGEFRINDANVGATASSDDQYSVLEITSGTLSTIVGTSTVDMKMLINTNSVNFTLSGGMGTLSVGLIITSAVNAQAITNVTAFTLGSAWGLRVANGADFELAVSTGAGSTITTRASVLGALELGGVSVMFGSLAVSTADITSYNGQSSAIAKAVAINAVSNDSGNVSATVRSNTAVATAAVQADAIAAGDVYINGIDLGDVTVLLNDSDGALVTAINAISTSTGVTASVASATGRLTLTATDGRNITLTAESSIVTGNTFGLGATAHANNTYIYRSTLRLNDTEAITLAGTLTDLYELSTDSTVGTTDTSKTVTVDTSLNVANLSISTRLAAEEAILTLDSALDTVNSIRADIGAIQNRVEFTVANLEIASENMSASESRIRDADFAMEVSIFTRNQILVQAGTAMLAQANTQPQIALQLLA